VKSGQETKKENIYASRWNVKTIEKSMTTMERKESSTGNMREAQTCSKWPKERSNNKTGKEAI